MIFFENMAMIVLIALVIDVFIGDPDAIWKKIPHPVVWIGKAIDWLDRQGNDPAKSEVERRSAGVFAVVALIVGAAVIGLTLELLLRGLPFAELWIALVGSILLAGNSLEKHVADVRRALNEGIEPARVAVARIVGRDTAALDESGVVRATLESTAESTSDGIIAPAFWFLLFGLPGLIAYKAINTADSMIGHRTPKHEAFGAAAARTDDVMNGLPARLSAWFIAWAGRFTFGAQPDAVIAAAVRDAPAHASPNAGWPETAFAHVLGVALGGPRSYDGELHDGPWFNADGRRELVATDIDRGLTLLRASVIAVGVVLVPIILLSWIF